MSATSVEPWILAIGDGARIECIAADMRTRGYATMIARSLSEVRMALAAAHLPTLIILDGRAYAPWRADALERISRVVQAAATRLVWIGGSGRLEASVPHLRRVPADAPLATITGAALLLLTARHESAADAEAVVQRNDGAAALPRRPFARAATQP